MANRTPLILILLAAVAIAIYSSIFVVNEREQAIVLRFGEIIRVEWTQIINPFPDTDVAYWQPKLLRQCENNTALRSTVELSQGQTRNAHRLQELLGLVPLEAPERQRLPGPPPYP